MKRFIFVVVLMIVMMLTSVAVANETFSFYVDSSVDFTVWVTVYDKDLEELDFFEKDFAWEITSVDCSVVQNAYIYFIEIFITNEEDYSLDNFIYFQYECVGIYSDNECCEEGYISVDLYTEH